MPDVALLGWLHCDDLARRLEAEIDAAADDKVALSSTQREEAAADVERELLKSPGSRRAWCGAGLPKDCRSSFAKSAHLGRPLRRVGHAASQARWRHDGGHSFAIVGTANTNPHVVFGTRLNVAQSGRAISLYWALARYWGAAGTLQRVAVQA